MYKLVYTKHAQKDAKKALSGIPLVGSLLGK